MEDTSPKDTCKAPPVVAEEAGVVIGDSFPIDAAAERSVLRKLDFR